MPPRLPRVAIEPSRIVRLSSAPKSQQTCPLCSIARSLRRRFSKRRPISVSRCRPSPRQQSSIASASASREDFPIRPKNARFELRDALADLQKQAGSYVNISRLQLALRGLDQPPGRETIRIALLGLGESEIDSLKKAKTLLRLLLADPLKEEEDWEGILTNSNSGNKPLLLKVGFDGTERLSQSSPLIQELSVPSPMLNGHKLEILVLDIDNSSVGTMNNEELVDTLLIPSMRTTSSGTGRSTAVTIPVHKSLVIGDGIASATVLQQHSFQLDGGLIKFAVNFRSVYLDEDPKLLFQIVNIEKGTAALQSFRKSVNNAMIYEKDWFASGIPELLEFLKDGTASTEKAMKAPLRSLIEGLLRHANRDIYEEEGRRLSAALSAKLSSIKVESLRSGLSQWAERAHTELRDSLDIAFNGRRWRRLSWWKLFWRVDDVSAIATDILNQRFLIDAEREVIYLAGVIDEALSKESTLTFNKDWAYKPVTKQEDTGILKHAPPPRLKDVIEVKDDSSIMIKPQPWPLEIPVTRALLASDTIPALQALAQKLVLQTLSTSTFSTALAGLIYVSTISTSMYEVGAVAALGVVWSLQRMQGKWETARKFWEGEVTEEGRKAVRAVESVVNNALIPKDRPLEGAEELRKAKEALGRAEAALEACK